MCPHKIYMEALSPRSSVTLCRKRVTADVTIKMRLNLRRVVLNLRDYWCPYKMEGCGHRGNQGGDDVKGDTHHSHVKTGRV